MQKLAASSLQRVLRQLRDESPQDEPEGWTCRDCGIEGEFKTRDMRKCAAYVGSKFDPGLLGLCLACESPPGDHFYSGRFCFPYLATWSGGRVEKCKTCGKTEALHHGNRQHCYVRQFFSYCCICHAHRYQLQNDQLCSHCLSRWTYLREFEMAQMLDEAEGADLLGTAFLKRIHADDVSEFGDEDIGKPIPAYWRTRRQFFLDPNSKFRKNEIVVAFRSDGSRQFGRLMEDHGNGTCDVLVSRTGGATGKGQFRSDAVEDIGKIGTRTVGYALRHRFDVLATRALLQTSEGVKIFVSRVKEGNFPSSCTDGAKPSSFFDGDGKLRLDLSICSANIPEEDAPGTGSRRNVPKLLSMKSIAFGLSGLYGILASLDVSGHKNLESLPVQELVTIKSLEFLGCRGCFRLASPPAEIADQGGFAAMQYLRLARPEEGGVLNTAIELITIGTGEGGKTSVINALMHGKSEKIDAENRTVGMDLFHWSVDSSSEAHGLSFNVKDLAGQASFDSEVLDAVATWLDSLQVRVPGAKIIVVATHINCTTEIEVDRQCLLMQELIQNKQQELLEGEAASGTLAFSVWNQGESFRVDCLDGSGIKQLRQNLINMAIAHPAWQEGIPRSYVQLKQRIVEQRQENAFLSWQEYRKLACECGVIGSHIKIATTLLHDNSTLKFFGQYPSSELEHEAVGDFVYINPHWIIDSLKGLIRHQRDSLMDFFASHTVSLDEGDQMDWIRRIQRLAAYGILHAELVPFLWPGGLTGLSHSYWVFVQTHTEQKLWPRTVASSQQDYDKVLALLEGCDVLTRLNEAEYLAPALLAGTQHNRLDPRAFEPGSDRSIEMSISIPQMPEGFFSKLLIKLRRQYSHLDFSASAAALYGRGLKAQLFLIDHKVEAKGSRPNRFVVTLNMMTSTQRQMDQMLQHIEELHKFFPGMCSIDAKGIVSTALNQTVITHAQSKSKHNKTIMEPIQVQFIQSTIFEVGDTVEIRQTSQIEEEQIVPDIRGKWKLPPGAFDLKFEVVEASDLLYLRPPDQIRESMARQLKEELQREKELKQELEFQAKDIQSKLDSSQAQLEALKLQFSKIKSGSLMCLKNGLNGTEIQGTFLKPGDIVMVMESEVASFLLGEIAGTVRLQFKNVLLPELKRRIPDWSDDHNFAVIKDEDENVFLSLTVVLRDCLSEIILEELNSRTNSSVDLFERKEDQFRRQLERIRQGSLKCPRSAIRRKKVFPEDNLKQGDIVFVFEGQMRTPGKKDAALHCPLTSCFLGQNLGRNDCTTELQKFRANLVSEVKLRASGPVDRMEVARNEPASASEIMLKLPEDVKDVLLRLMQSELKIETDLLQDDYIKHTSFKQQLLAQSVVVDEFRQQLAKFRDIDLPVPRKNDFFFRELGRDGFKKGRVELSSDPDDAKRYSFSNKLKKLMLREENHSIHIQEAGLKTPHEWTQTGASYIVKYDYEDNED